jgi:cell division protein FtsB
MSLILALIVLAAVFILLAWHFDKPAAQKIVTLTKAEVAAVEAEGRVLANKAFGTRATPPAPAPVPVVDPAPKV